MTAFIPMAKPSGRCFGTAKDFDNLGKRPQPLLWQDLRACVFRTNRSTAREARGARLETRARVREVHATVRDKNGSAQQDRTGDGRFPGNWTSHCVGAC